MKKRILALTGLLLLSCASMAFAAGDPFADVPSGHWAYGALSKLSDSGVITNYRADSFQGNRTMSRYEMALLVGNAMTKSEKADADTKILIDKLAQEFADELKALGKLMTDTKETLKENPEENPNKPKEFDIDGFMAFTYEYTKNPRVIAEDLGANAPSGPSWAGRATHKSETRTTVGLNFRNQFDGSTYFKGFLMGDYISARTTSTPLHIWESYVADRIGPQTEIAFGRFMPILGMGTLGSGPYQDGVRLSFNGAVKANLYAVKFGAEGLNPVTNKPYDSYNFYSGDVHFALNPNVNMSVAYFGDSDQEMYDSTAVGIKWQASKDLVVSSEFTRNNASTAKVGNDFGSAPTGYYILAKYKGANPFVPGSTGVWAEYRKADPGLDTMHWSYPTQWNAPFNWATPGHGGCADNIKGFEIGLETTVAPRLIFSATYADLERISATSVTSLASDVYGGKKDQSFMTARMTYLF